MKKKTVLNEVIGYYLKSNDFNGLPIYGMELYDYNALCQLIDEGLVEVLSGKEVINPHIKGFDINIPVELQKKNILNKENHAVLYPTKKALKPIAFDHTKPYTSLLQKGEKQFAIVYFSIEILERYANNPMFVIMDSGYRGNIYIRDEYLGEGTIGSEYIKDYGMAYIDGINLHRAVGVIVRDLARLSPQKQILWKGFELTDQKVCKIAPGFVDNLFKNKWVKKVWIFHALLEEMKVINEQCRFMSIPKLFNKTFGTHYSEMPEGFRNIFLPTLKNYYDFVLVLEKIIVHNISYKTFQKKAPYISNIDRKDNMGRNKGSLLMLEEWLNINIQTKENISDLIVKPLRRIRSIRQKPAHVLISNKFDVQLYQKQFDLMNETYGAIRAIRLFFSNHPIAKEAQIPDHLVSGKDIVNY